MTGEPALLRPPTGELRLVDDVAAAFVAVVADELARHRGATGADRRAFTLALSGGSTARACYERLASQARIDLDGVELLVGDERCVPPDDPDANQAMIRSVLADRIGEADAFFPMDCGDVDGYDEIVRERAPLDLVHLGVGPDGHTASLFPSSPALESAPGRLVVTNHDPLGNNPHRRLTLTFEALSKTRLAVFTVSGSAKHDALHRVLCGEALPAARVGAARVVWLCDRDALGEDLDRVQ